MELFVHRCARIGERGNAVDEMVRVNLKTSPGSDEAADETEKFSESKLADANTFSIHGRPRRVF